MDLPYIIKNLGLKAQAHVRAARPGLATTPCGGLEAREVGPEGEYRGVPGRAALSQPLLCRIRVS
jgi:hypothetical protein